MDSRSCEDTVSIARNEAFKDFKVAPYYHDTTGLLAASGPAELPLSMTDEMIPRLDRMIELLEAQLKPQRQPGARPNQGGPASNMVNMQRSIKSLKNQARAAKRRSRTIRAKARAKDFPTNNGATFTIADRGTTREAYHATRRDSRDKGQIFFTSCWPESEEPYDGAGSYKEYPEYRDSKVAMSW